MVCRLLDFYEIYKDPAKEPNPLTTEQQEEIYGKYDVHNIQIRDFLEQAMDAFYITEENKRPVQKREYRKVFLIYNPKDATRIIARDSMRLAEKQAESAREFKENFNVLAENNKKLTEEVNDYKKLTQSQAIQMKTMQNQLNLLMQQMQNLTSKKEDK